MTIDVLIKRRQDLIRKERTRNIVNATAKARYHATRLFAGELPFDLRDALQYPGDDVGVFVSDRAISLMDLADIYAGTAMKPYLDAMVRSYQSFRKMDAPNCKNFVPERPPYLFDHHLLKGW